MAAADDPNGLGIRQTRRTDCRELQDGVCHAITARRNCDSIIVLHVEPSGRYGPIEALPEGDYVVEAWHEKYGTKQANLSVGADGAATLDFEFSE